MRWGAVGAGPAVAALLVAGLAGPVPASDRADPGAAAFKPRPPDVHWTPKSRPARRYAKRRQGEVRFAIVDLRGRMRKLHGGRTAPWRASSR